MKNENPKGNNISNTTYYFRKNNSIRQKTTIILYTYINIIFILFQYTYVLSRKAYLKKKYIKKALNSYNYNNNTVIPHFAQFHYNAKFKFRAQLPRITRKSAYMVFQKFIHVWTYCRVQTIMMTVCQTIKNSVGCYERILQERKKNATQKTIDVFFRKK